MHVAHSNLRSEAVAALANALIAILELIRQFID
nr:MULTISPECIES: DinQ-like type I toxin DqlB [Enterobacteriaceae]